MIVTFTQVCPASLEHYSFGLTNKRFVNPTLLPADIINPNPLPILFEYFHWMTLID